MRRCNRRSMAEENECANCSRGGCMCQVPENCKYFTLLAFSVHHKAAAGVSGSFAWRSQQPTVSHCQEALACSHTYGITSRRMHELQPCANVAHYMNCLPLSACRQLWTRVCVQDVWPALSLLEIYSCRPSLGAAAEGSRHGVIKVECPCRRRAALSALLCIVGRLRCNDQGVVHFGILLNTKPGM